MTIRIFPSHPSGRIEAPPSKSATHRLLVAAALAKGESRLRGIAQSDDIAATLDCIGALGASFDTIDGNVTVRGTDGKPNAGRVFPCRESATTLRFLMPLCLTAGGGSFLCKGRLAGRPHGAFFDLCDAIGVRWSVREDRIELAGNLAAGEYAIRADDGSQFVSGLLYALPLLAGDSRLRLSGRIVSRPYVEMTRAALRLFGVLSDWEDRQTLFIPGNQRYRAATATVEGDFSAAAVFDALNYLGGAVTVGGLPAKSEQADGVYPAYFAALTRGEPLSLADCPDLGPILFALAAELGEGRFTDAARLRGKESDRILSMKTELSKFGASLTEEGGAIIVSGGALHPPEDRLDGHGDHRVVMALAALAARYGGCIDGAEAVSKSMPDFFDRLRTLGVKCEICQ